MTKMGKVNVIMGVVLAIIVMFSINVITYRKAYTNGVTDYSDYIETQKQLKIRNELKSVVEDFTGNEGEEHHVYYIEGKRVTKDEFEKFEKEHGWL